jgi:hypothetical protein
MRTQVGPALTRDKSSTRKRDNAFDALILAIVFFSVNDETTNQVPMDAAADRN